MSSGIAEKKYRCGDIRESDGKIFLEYRRDYIRKNGERKIAERWVAPEIFAKKRAYKAEYRKRPECKERGSLLSKIRSKKQEVIQRRRETRKKYIRRAEFKVKYNASIKKRVLQNPQFAIARRVRARIRMAIKRAGLAKKDKTEELIGCSYSFLRGHVEKQFRDGMTWDDPSSFHIDHIRPICSFDLTDPEQLKAAFHWSNVQPLTPEENLRKGHSWPSEILLLT
jgi:hypothetical protein